MKAGRQADRQIGRDSGLVDKLNTEFCILKSKTLFSDRHFADTVFGCHSHGLVIWSTHIVRTSYLVDTAVALVMALEINCCVSKSHCCIKRTLYPLNVC
jgi:hypothetical protein